MPDLNLCCLASGFSTVLNVVFIYELAIQQTGPAAYIHTYTPFGLFSYKDGDASLEGLCKAPIKIGASLGRVSIYLGQQYAARCICTSFRGVYLHHAEIFYSFLFLHHLLDVD